MVTDWSALAIPWELLPAAAGGEARVRRREVKLRLEGALVRAAVVQPARNHALAQLENLALPRLPVLPATGSSRPLPQTRLAGHSDGKTYRWI